MVLNVSYLTTVEISEAVDAFRERHSLNEIPIDFDFVVENDLNITVLPLGNLHQIAETDGFITNDFSTIM